MYASAWWSTVRLRCRTASQRHFFFKLSLKKKWRAERDSTTPPAAVHGCGRPIAEPPRRNRESGGLPTAIRWWRWDAAAKGREQSLEQE